MKGHRMGMEEFQSTTLFPTELVELWETVGMAPWLKWSHIDLILPFCLLLAS